MACVTPGGQKQMCFRSHAVLVLSVLLSQAWAQTNSSNNVSADAVSVLRSEIASLRKDLAAKDQKNTDREDLVQRLVSEGAVLTRILETSKTAQQALQNNVSDLQSTVTLKLESIKQLTSQNGQITTENDAISKQLKLTEAELKSKTKELESANRWAQRESEIKAKRESEIEALRVACRVNKTILKSRIKDMQAQLDSKNEQLAEIVENSEQKMGALRSQVNKAESERNEVLAAYHDPSVQHFLEAKAMKVYEHPGVHGTINNTFKYVLPSLKLRYSRGAELVNQTKDQLQDRLNAYIGSDSTEPYLPLISGMLVYGLGLVPFLCTVVCLTQVLCRRREVLVFLHVWLTLSCLSASGFALATGKEPLVVFSMQDPALYLFSQVSVAVLLCAYTGLVCVSLFLARCGTREPCYRVCQGIALTPLLSAYFVFIWTPAMHDRLPEMDEMVLSMLRRFGSARIGSFAWMPYAVGTAIFAAQGLLEVLCFKEVQYSRKLELIETKVNMRTLEELAALVPGKTQDIELGEKRA